MKQVTIVCDEPTTKMDAEYRENLARHFDQAIVISHDETFDSYVDNVLAVGA
jgi:DNA repair exonuclease SbcCD ATPase subunit